MHIPSDAKALGPVFLGSSSAWGTGVLVTNWFGDLPYNGKIILKEGTWSDLNTVYHVSDEPDTAANDEGPSSWKWNALVAERFLALC